MGFYTAAIEGATRNGPHSLYSFFPSSSSSSHIKGAEECAINAITCFKNLGNVESFINEYQDCNVSNVQGTTAIFIH